MRVGASTSVGTNSNPFGFGSTFAKFEFERVRLLVKWQSSSSNEFDFAKFEMFGFDFFRVRPNTIDLKTG